MALSNYLYDNEFIKAAELAFTLDRHRDLHFALQELLLKDRNEVRNEIDFVIQDKISFQEQLEEEAEATFQLSSIRNIKKKSQKLPSEQKLFKESSLKKGVRLLMNKDAKKFIEIVKRMNTQQKFCEVVQ